MWPANQAWLLNMFTFVYLYVPGPFLSLVGHPLFNADQFLLQISHLMLMKLCQIIQLVFQTLVPSSERIREMLMYYTWCVSVNGNEINYIYH